MRELEREVAALVGLLAQPDTSHLVDVHRSLVGQHTKLATHLLEGLRMVRGGQIAQAEKLHAQGALEASRQMRDLLSRQQHSTSPRYRTAALMAKDWFAALDKALLLSPLAAREDPKWRGALHLRIQRLSSLSRAERRRRGLFGPLLLEEIRLYQDWIDTRKLGLPLDLLLLESEALLLAGDLGPAKIRLKPLVEVRSPRTLRPAWTIPLKKASEQTRALYEKSRPLLADVARLKLVELALLQGQLKEAARDSLRLFQELQSAGLAETLPSQPTGELSDLIRSMRLDRLALLLRTLALLKAGDVARATQNERLRFDRFGGRRAAEFTRWIELFYTDPGRQSAIDSCESVLGRF